MNASAITGLFIKKHLKWIIIILRCLEETKISIQELRNEEKYYDFLNMIIIDYSSCQQLMSLKEFRKLNEVLDSYIKLLQKVFVWFS